MFSYLFLQSKIETNNKDAEKFSAYSLKTIGEGGSRGEIARLYIIPTAIVVVASLLISYPLISVIMVKIFRVMLKQMMSGWMVIWLDPRAYVEMFIMAIVTYAVVAFIEYRKIGKIPMSEALKNVE